MECKRALVRTRSDAPAADQDLQLLREVVALGNQTEDFESTLRAALPRIARRYACAAGQAFVLAGDRPERLVLCGTRYDAVAGLFTSLGTPASQDLESAGYLRRIVESQAPQCTAALEADLSARGKAALEAGLLSALAVPVVAGAETGAVLEFFADHIIECDGATLGTLASVGVALGRVLERQRCSSAARRTERLVSLGTFAAGIAHELNNPLSSILVTARVARRQDYGKEHLHDILGEIIADAERCAQIVRNLVKFAHQEPSERTAVNVSELIRRVVGIARRAFDKPEVRLELDISEPLPAVLAEATAIEQALVSVVNGALQASEPGRAVRVQAGESNGNVRIRLFAGDLADAWKRRGSKAPLAGPGHQPTPAFEMAQDIITQHGGTIAIDKWPGGGSRITIELPLGGQSPGRASE